MKRRDFLITSAAAGVVLGTTPLLNVSCKPAPKKLDKIGLQLFTMGMDAFNDMEGTLTKVKAAGYDQVEFAGYGNLKPEEIRAILDKLELTSPANHARNLFTEEGLQQSINEAKIIGHDYLIVPSLPRETPVPAPQPADAASEKPAEAVPPAPPAPPAPPTEAQSDSAAAPPPPPVRTEPVYTVEKAMEFVKGFTHIAEACKEAGLGFCFHSHQVEWKNVTGGDVMMDIFLQETDPELVNFEIDLGWAVAAGVDPLVYFEKYPGRFHFYHVKDITADKVPCVIGEGIIDFKPIFAAAELAGAKYFIVEQDSAPDPVNNVTASANYLKNLTF